MSGVQDFEQPARTWFADAVRYISQRSLTGAEPSVKLMLAGRAFEFRARAGSPMVQAAVGVANTAETEQLRAFVRELANSRGQNTDWVAAAQDLLSDMAHSRRTGT